jgi:hypothetical protein
MHRLLSIIEIVSEILQYLPCKDIVNFGHSHRRGRCISVHILRMRFRLLIHWFLPIDCYERFLNSLHTTGSFIAGSAAVWMLLYPCHWKPLQLDICTPKYQRQRIVQILRAAAFGSSREMSVSRAYREFIASRCSITSTHPPATVIITESKTANPLLPIFVSPNTSLMNAVSAHEILCLYPTLTLSKMAFILRTRGRQSDMHHIECEEREITLSESNERSSRPCGCGCPDIWRRVSGMRGMAVFRWEDSKNKNSFKRLSDDFHYSWTIGRPCQNRYCSNCTVSS